METYSSTTRFILTCNYVEKIIDPIQSRCQVFYITIPTKTVAAKKIAGIMTKENISYDPLDVKEIVDNRTNPNTCFLQSILSYDTKNLYDINYPNKCNRGDSEKFLLNNASFIEY